MFGFRDKRSEALTRNMERLGIAVITGEEVAAMDGDTRANAIRKWEEDLKLVVRKRGGEEL